MLPSMVWHYSAWPDPAWPDQNIRLRRRTGSSGDLTWPDSTCPDLTSSSTATIGRRSTSDGDLIWPDPTWPDPTWPDLARPDLARPDRTRPDLTWPADPPPPEDGARPASSSASSATTPGDDASGGRQSSAGGGGGDAPVDNWEEADTTSEAGKSRPGLLRPGEALLVWVNYHFDTLTSRLANWSHCWV